MVLSPLDVLTGLDDLLLNSTQAAAAAGVQRSVVPVWARRHESFPPVVEQVGEKKFYSAVDFVTWCAGRSLTKPVEQIAADAAVVGAANLYVRQPVETTIASFLTFVLVYRYVEFVEHERAVALLRRCAQAYPYLARVVQPFLLKVTPDDVRVLGRVGALVAHSTEGAGAALGLLMQTLQQGASRVLSPATTDFLADLLAELGRGIHLYLGAGTDALEAVELLGSLGEALPDGLIASSADKSTGQSDFLRLLQAVVSSDGLSAPVEQGKVGCENSTLLTCLPLPKAAATYENYWLTLGQLVDDAPPGAPIVVLGRAEFLAAPVSRAASVTQRAKDAHHDLLRLGHLLAVIDVGPRGLPGESNVALAVAVLENHRVSDHSRPQVAVFSCENELKRESTYRKSVLHDVSTLTYEDWESPIHSAGGEHTLVAGQFIRWEQIASEGARPRGSRRKILSGQSRITAVNESLRRLQQARLRKPQLEWPAGVNQAATEQLTVGQLVSRGVLRRLPGYAPSRLPQGQVQQVSGPSAAAWVRLLDEQGVEQVRSLGELPQVFWGLVPAGLASLDESVQLAQVGDVVVSEGQAAAFVVGQEHGLLLVQAPLVVLRAADGYRAAPGSCDLLARLLAAVLGEQKTQGVKRPKLVQVRVPAALAHALAGLQVGEPLEVLGRQLDSVAAYKRVLLAQVRELEQLERQTLAGWADGTIGMR